VTCASRAASAAAAAAFAAAAAAAPAFRVGRPFLSPVAPPFLALSPGDTLSSAALCKATLSFL